MGGLNPGIPLSVNPPQQPVGPLQQYGQIMSVQSLINQNALQKQEQANNALVQKENELKLKSQQQDFQDQQTLRSLASQFATKDPTTGVGKYDFEGLANKALEQGVNPLKIQQMRLQNAQVVESTAKAGSDQLALEIAKNKNVYEKLESLKAIQDPEQRLAAQKPILNGLALQQHDVSAINPNKPLSDEELTNYETQLGMHGQILSDAKTKAETDKDAAQARADAADAALKEYKLKLTTSSKPEDFMSAIDAIAPPAGNTAMANQRAKTMVSLALRTGDLEGAKEAVAKMAAGQQQIENETDPRVLKFKAREAANSAAAQQAVRNGSAADAGRFMAQGIVAPSEIAARSNPSFLTEATKAALAINPNFNVQKAEADFNVAKSPENVRFFGSAKSLTDKAGTLDQLKAAGDDIPQNQIPVFNTVADAVKASTGSGPVAKYAALALGVADDYAKVMGGGTGSDTSREQALKLISANQSPEQRAASIEGIRGAVASQTGSRIGNNAVLKNMYGSSGQESGAAAKSSGHVIALNGKHYQYKGTGSTTDISNYTEVK